jgi:hypothetical protein
VLHHIVLSTYAFLGHQRGVSGYAIQYAKIIGFPYLVKVCGVDEKLHFVIN